MGFQYNTADLNGASCIAGRVSTARTWRRVLRWSYLGTLGTTPSLLAVVWHLFQPRETVRKRKDCGVQGRASLTRNPRVSFDLQFLPLTSDLPSMIHPWSPWPSPPSPTVEPQRCPQLWSGRRTLRSVAIRLSAQKSGTPEEILPRKGGTVTLELKIVWYGRVMPGQAGLRGSCRGRDASS